MNLSQLRQKHFTFTLSFTKVVGILILKIFILITIFALFKMRESELVLQKNKAEEVAQNFQAVIDERDNDLKGYKSSEEGKSLKKNEEPRSYVQVDQTIDGKKYTVVNTGKMDPTSGTMYIVEEDGGVVNDPQRAVLTKRLASEVTDNTTDFWIDFKTKEIILMTLLNNVSLGSVIIEKVNLEELDPNKGLYGEVEILYYGEGMGALEGMSIQTYDGITETLIISKGSGDGCGGSGTIYQLKNKVEKPILNYFAGCAIGEGQLIHRFGGVYRGQLVVGDAIPIPDAQSKNPMGKVVELQNVYLLDPFTLQKTNVNIPKEKLTDLDIHYVENEEKLGIAFASHIDEERRNEGGYNIVYYNPDTKTFTKKETE